MMVAGIAGLLLLAIVAGQKHSVAHKQRKIEHRARQMGHDLHFSE